MTITRPIPNEYGTMNEKLQFEYSLGIHPCEENTVPYITQEEQVIIERWLTSPKFSSNLYIINDNEDILAVYCGKFINTNWIPFDDGYLMVTFTFENDSAYAKEPQSFTFQNKNNESGSWNFTIPCGTDELEEYVYPVITIYNTDQNSGEQTYRITNNSDTGTTNSMVIKVLPTSPVSIDCRNCVLYTRLYHTLSFDDLGWEDVGSIYWPRLLPGDNLFSIDRPCRVEVTFDEVSKKVGGWLYD